MDFWFVIFSIGLVQGLFLIAALLALRSKRRISIYLLVGMILCCLTLIVNEWVKTSVDIEQIAFTFRAGETIPLLIGPLFLFYIMSVVKPDFKFNQMLWWHFIPFLFFLLLFMPFYLKSSAYKIEYIRALNQQTPPVSLALFSLFKGLHTAAYFIVSLFYLRKHADVGVANSWFNAKLLNKLIWVQLMALALIYSLVGLEHFYPTVEYESDRISSLILTVSFFVLAFTIILVPSSLIPPQEKRREKYFSSSLTAQRKQVIIDNMLNLFSKEKPYLKSELSLTALSTMLQITPNELSQVINEKLGKNFHQLINEYRVEEVKHNIGNPSKTLLGIALESGFNSKSAFNRTFKEITGLTPSEYKKTL